MMKNIPYIENLTALYLKGEASPDQAMELEDWKSQSIENKKMFDQMQKAFHLTHHTNAPDTMNMPEAWETIQTLTKLTEPKISFWKKPILYYMAAASLVLGLMLPMLWRDYFNASLVSVQTTQKKPNSEVLTPENTPLTYRASTQNLNIELQDQSKVLLTKGSVMTLAQGFNENERKIKLEGSARFTVTHNEKKPFKVLLDQLQIIDIGTVFEVKSSQDTVRIVVLEGAVELRLNHQLIEMHQGDSAFYLMSKQIIKQYQEKSSRNNKVFAFDGTKLSEVAVVLSSFYNKNISVSKEIQDCEVSVTFKNEELATILDVIKELMDIKMTMKDQNIELYGKGCN